jgi:hypothetical protein
VDHQLQLAFIANIVFGLSVIAAVNRPMIARTFLAVAFLGSSLFNFVKLTNIAYLTTEEEMSMLPLFKNYAIGLSGDLIYSTVLTIAILQLLIAAGLLLNKRWAIISLITGMSYGLFISSLGGYEFPAALLMSIAFLILAGNYKHDYWWHWNQYQIQDHSPKSHRSITG